MKKKVHITSIIIVVIIVLIICILIVGCNRNKKALELKDSPYIGTWKSNSMIVDDELARIISKGKHIITLKDDGTASFEIANEKGKSKWKITKDGIELTGKKKMKLRYFNGTLHTDVADVTFIYVKQK